jgi:dipeptidyl aminopeptidase/acylaminoacyl peptidase
VAPLLVLQGSNDYIVEAYHAEDLISELKDKGKTYEAMFQQYEGHCVTYCGEKATLEYLEIQEDFINKYLKN